MTPKQQTFAQEYLKDLNATQAAKRAGYSHPQVQGSQLLTHPAVKSRVQTELQSRSERVRVDTDWVITKLCLEASSPSNNASVRVKALELLGRHLGIFTSEVSKPLNQADFLFADHN
jgi:phage terminase small subunit